MLVLLSGLAAAAALQAGGAPPATGGRLAALLHTSPLGAAPPRAAPLRMMGAKKKASPPPPDSDDSRKSDSLVDGMTTSLGREEELQPYPGPAVQHYEVDADDGRRLFVSLAEFAPCRVPSEALQGRYMAWLGAEEALELPHYLLAPPATDVDESIGIVLSDDEIARRDAEEEEAAAAAAAATRARFRASSSS
jgi:hypothetical protein